MSSLSVTYAVSGTSDEVRTVELTRYDLDDLDTVLREHLDTVTDRDARDELRNLAARVDVLLGLLWHRPHAVVKVEVIP